MSYRNRVFGQKERKRFKHLSAVMASEGHVLKICKTAVQRNDRTFVSIPFLPTLIHSLDQKQT